MPNLLFDCLELQKFYYAILNIIQFMPFIWLSMAPAAIRHVFFIHLHKIKSFQDAQRRLATHFAWLAPVKTLRKG